MESIEESTSQENCSCRTNTPLFILTCTHLHHHFSNIVLLLLQLRVLLLQFLHSCSQLHILISQLHQLALLITHHSVQAQRLELAIRLCELRNHTLLRFDLLLVTRHRLLVELLLHITACAIIHQVLHFLLQNLYLDRVARRSLHRVHDHRLHRVPLHPPFSNRQAHRQHDVVVHYPSSLGCTLTHAIILAQAVLHVVQKVLQLHRVVHLNRRRIDGDHIIIGTARQVERESLEIGRERCQHHIYSMIPRNKHRLFESRNSITGGSKSWK